MGHHHEIARVATARHGILRIDHFQSVGLAASTVSRMVRAGRIVRVHHGVYSVGHAPISHRGRWLAAVDAVGPGAALTGRSAAQLWRIDRGSTSPTSVIVDRRHRPVAGIVIRQSRTLVPGDVVEVDTIPVLSVERLLWELADVHDEGRLCRWIDEARHLRVLDRDALGAVLDRFPGRRGTACLRRALMMLDDGSAGYRSAWEEMVIEKLATPRGVTRLVCTRRTFGSTSVEPDVHYVELGLVVQVDGPDHDRPNRRREDRRIDDALRAAGVDTIRIHWRDEASDIARANREVARRARRRT